MTVWMRVFKPLAVITLCVGLSSHAHAQAGDPFAAAMELADGGKHANAVKAYSGILNSGSLSPKNTARGFYLRGVSYTKSGKNPQAISDLTNALWLSGLSDAERANAYSMRAAAYRASGFKAKAAADLKRAKKAPTGTAVAAAAVATQAPAPTTADTSWSTQTATGATTIASTQTATKPAQIQESGNAVSSFLGGLFGGGTQTASSASNGSTTALSRDGAPSIATTAPTKRTAPAATQRPKKVATNDTSVSSWSSEVAATPAKPVVRTKVKPKPKPAAKQVAAVNWNTAVATTPTTKPAKTTAARKPAKPVKARKTPSKGRYNVQVATVRDRASAEQIRKTVAAQAPKALGGLKPSIDTAVLGNMGTFFRVRVDGLPTRQASANLCKTLARQGHDCFLLTR